MTTELCGWLRYLRCVWWRAGLVEADADTVWKQQNDAARRNVAYQLIALSGNGELQCKYRHEGAEALREHMRWFLPKHLYYDGKKAGVITRMEFARYRHRLSKKEQTKICKICKEDNDWTSMTVCDECGCSMHIYCLSPILPKVPEDLWYCDECKQDEENVQYTESLLNDILLNDKDVADVRDHAACWNLKMRGVCGETPLHICYLSSTDEDKDIARIMLEEFPFLALDVYEGTTFFGENALHFAIVRKDMDSAKLLVKHGVSLVARACGTFFLPSDVQDGSRTREKTHYKGHAYYGEYPLAFAACFGLVEMYDYLIAQSESNPTLGVVNPDAQDSFGNTVLHMCVIHRQKTMYMHALKHPVLPADQKITNARGLTPLALACKLGHSDMFEVVLDLSSQPFWTYGKISCLACPLDLLDTIGPEGERNDLSALSIIAKGSTKGHFEMLESGVIARLLDEKWQRYIRARFIFKFVWAFLHLAQLFVATHLRPVNQNKLIGPTDTRSIVRYIMEIGVIIGCTAKFVTEALEMKLLKPKRYFQNLVQVPARLIFCIACFLLYLCAIFRCTGHYTLEEYTLMIAIPCSWTYIFFFYRGTEMLGPYVVMIGKMLEGDILRFWIIMSTCLTLFASVFYFLFLDGNLGKDDGSNEGFSLPWRAFVSLFGMTFGNFDYTEFYKSRLNWISTVLFIIFMVVSPILLLNMLIAMMAKTYEEVKERARVEWKRQWARIILVMEGAVPKEKLLHHQATYSVEVPGNMWSDIAKAARRDREKIRQDAGLHMKVFNPVYEPESINEDVTSSRDNLIIPKKNTLTKDAWQNFNENTIEEPPKTVRALLIMKAMAKSQTRIKKRAKFNWSIVREIIDDKAGKDKLTVQGSSGEKSKPSLSLAFRAMTSAIKNGGAIRL